MADAASVCFAYQELKRQIDADRIEIYQKLYRNGTLGRQLKMHEIVNCDRKKPSPTTSTFFQGGIIDTVALYEGFLRKILKETAETVENDHSKSLKELEVVSCVTDSVKSMVPEAEVNTCPLFHRWVNTFHKALIPRERKISFNTQIESDTAHLISVDIKPNLKQKVQVKCKGKKLTEIKEPYEEENWHDLLCIYNKTIDLEVHPARAVYRSAENEEDNSILFSAGNSVASVIRLSPEITNETILSPKLRCRLGTNVAKLPITLQPPSHDHIKTLRSKWSKLSIDLKPKNPDDDVATGLTLPHEKNIKIQKVTLELPAAVRNLEISSMLIERKQVSTSFENEEEVISMTLQPQESEAICVGTITSTVEKISLTYTWQLDTRPEIHFKEKLFEIEDHDHYYYHLLDNRRVSKLLITKESACALMRLSYSIRCVMAHGNPDYTLKHSLDFPICKECLKTTDCAYEPSKNFWECFKNRDNSTRSIFKPIKLQNKEAVDILKQNSLLQDHLKTCRACKIKSIFIISELFNDLIEEKHNGDPTEVIKESRKFPRPKPFEDLQDENDKELPLLLIKTIYPNITDDISQEVLNEEYAWFHLCRIYYWLKKGKREMYITCNMFIRVNQAVLVLAHKLYMTVARVLMDEYRVSDMLWGVPKNHSKQLEKIREFNDEHLKNVWLQSNLAATHNDREMVYQSCQDDCCSYFS